ncbi:hypothetical protein B0H14DRAFT_3483998 [Mycena olivaceomarginata]|nr:hypothetical protein B0H14DRAFT_3483998 [Mycena olivaceomarginata]
MGRPSEVAFLLVYLNTPSTASACPLQLHLSVHPTDSILAVKQRLAEQPNGPPVAAQRLLLKGKALADAKLVEEYPPRRQRYRQSRPQGPPPPPAPAGTGDRPVVSAAQAAAHPRRHTRIPSVVSRPRPPPSRLRQASQTVTDITLTLDADGGFPSEEINACQTLAEPAFWEGLLQFLK